MPVTFTRHGAARGALDILPLTVGVFLFGMAFGLLSVEAGLSALEASLMSGLVFAGASQFAAMQIWADPVPVATLILTTFAINARHQESIWILLTPSDRGHLVLEVERFAERSGATHKKGSARQAQMPRRLKGCHVAAVRLRLSRLPDPSEPVLRRVDAHRGLTRRCRCGGWMPRIVA